MLIIKRTELPEVLILEYKIMHDNRGRKQNTFSRLELEKIGINVEFVEETVYYIEKKGTLYGIHFQNKPYEQSKLIYCIKGRGLDFAIDLRKDSINYKKWIKIELNSENRRQVYIPKGFGHAFLALEDNTELIFRIDNYFHSDYSRSISYLDPELNIPFEVEKPILSKQDAEAPFLANSDCNM